MPKETVCPECGRLCGVLVGPHAPGSFRSTKRSVHVDRRKPKVGGRWPECVGSREELTADQMWDVQYGHNERRKIESARDAAAPVLTGEVTR